MALYANFEPFEGTVSGSQVIDFPWHRAYRAIIMNDSSTKDLTYNLNGKQATLRPTESVSFGFQVKDLSLAGDGVAYRVWLYG